MKSYKDIRSTISEEYYTGPTSYVGGDKTNVGNIGGADLLGLLTALDINHMQLLKII